MQKLFIHQAVSISAQGYWEGFQLPDLQLDLNDFKAIDPDYKTVIPAMSLRRMSKITKMALMCGLTISKKTELVWDGIIVGTGLGNLADTEKFLKQIAASGGGLNSPTAFTQSSHNTLSGQIALQFRNHGYNMTHVQKGFSFENALGDAMIQSQSGAKNLLLGAADEHIPFLDTLAKEMNCSEEMISNFGEGASFFHLSSAYPSRLFVMDILIKKKVDNLWMEVKLFLRKYLVDEDTCLFIKTSNVDLDTHLKQVSVAELVGNYMANSGFAMHLGCIHLQSQKFSHALIINADSENGLGLTLLSHE